MQQLSYAVAGFCQRAATVSDCDLSGTNPVYQATEMKQNENVTSFPV